nr:agmatinase [Ardenticatena sp.]
MPDFLHPNFLGLPEAYTRLETARALILPIPYEATVSYEAGTRRGPAAIIEASAQVELYDREFDDEPALRYGIHTLPALVPNFASPEAMVADIAEAVAMYARPGRLLVALGGEHTITAGVMQGLAQVYGEPLTMVQLDAHADLRDSFEGSRYSHACVARRVLEAGYGDVLQLGIRSVCTEEMDVIRREARVHVWFAEDVHMRPLRQTLDELAERVRGTRVHLTIDVDGFDPSIVPATGTPEPGGLTWYQVLAIVRTVAETADVVGVDCVELSPRYGQHMADFTMAKLLYKTMNYVLMKA